jgi:thiamine pyrophosphate-dependent acetolactate synthase large subunit-like protein
VLQNVLAQQPIPHGTLLHNPDFVALAAAYGADGVVGDAGADVPGVLEAAFRRPRERPFVIDLRVDPALMFPMSKWEQYTPPTLSRDRPRP